MSNKTDKIWTKVAKQFMNAGAIPFPITGKVLEICQSVLKEEQARFMQVFKTRSMTFDQIKDNLPADMDDNALQEKLDDLMHVGAISGIPSRNTGIMVYKVSPFVPGIVELELMRGLYGEKQEKIAKVHEEMFEEFIEMTQKNYDKMVPLFKNSPPVGRTVPVEEEMEAPNETVMPYEEVSKIIENAGVISIGSCYCRHGKDLTKDPCKKTKEKKKLFFFW